MDIARPRRPHPFVLGAAASVMLLSLAGTAAIIGVVPKARSQSAATAKSVTPVKRGAAPWYRQDRSPSAICTTCGTVTSIRRIELKGRATGLGALAGGLTGAVVGHQMGRGNGNILMTLLGAAGGAMAGNAIEKDTKRYYRYRIIVHMDDGSYRAFSQSRFPAVAVGQHVRIARDAVLPVSSAGGT